MKSIRVGILGIILLAWGITPLWAQFDMRNPNNPYAGMGRTGYALEERDKKLQEERAAQKAREQAAKQNKQTTTTTPTAKQKKK